jgi:hypothetical protein
MTGRNIAILIIRATSNDLDDIRPLVQMLSSRCSP